MSAVMVPPVCGFARQPLTGLRSSDMRTVPLGVPLRDLPALLGERVDDGLVICRVNGEWIDRASLESLTLPGDVIEFHRLPQDRDALRTVLTIAAMFISQWVPGAQGLALTLFATAAINILLPVLPADPAKSPQVTGDSFSTSLNGNQARIDQPIWRICGHREITPPFACEPYLEYRPRVDAEDPDLDHDQYFYCLYAIGIGEYDVWAKIGNTPIGRFADVLRAQYLAPGEQPTDVLANVTSAREVAGQILEPGRYVGGFAACAARRTCQSVGIDVAATRGLGKGGSPMTVEWRVEWRPINDFGQVLGPWEMLATESRTGYTATPQHWSSRYELETPGRVEVRVVRIDAQDTEPSALHEIAWIGLRAYLAEPAPLNPHAAHFEVVMRASSQLSQASSRDLRLIVRGRCRSLNENLESVAAAYTRNPGWWALDLVTSTTWGAGKPDSRVDLQSFYEFAQTCERRQDRFDYAFDSTMGAWDAIQLIARAGRARAFRRNGLISIARDEWIDVPVTAFTARNCTPGSITITETLPQRSTPDGVIVEYQDHRSGEWTAIECPCPGIDVEDMVNPVWKRLPGITGATQAEREGIYEAAVIVHRPRTVSLSTEMQGILPAFLDTVAVQPDIAGYGQTGDVVEWNGSTMLMTLSEPMSMEGELWLTLVRDDGTLTDPISVSPGIDANSVMLATPPDFTIVANDGTRERPKYLLGSVATARDLVKLLAIADGGKSEAADGDPGGAQLYALTGVIDDERVHTADNALLPSPDDDQDPIGLPDDSDEGGGGGGSGGGFLIVPRISDQSVEAYTESTSDTTDLVARITFDNNGRLQTFISGGTLPGAHYVPNEWSLHGLVEPAHAGQYEIRATVIYSYDWPGSDNTLSGTFGVWQPLDVNRPWELRNQYVSSSDARQGVRTIRFEIRETATGIVQDSGNITLMTFISGGGGGTGGEGGGA